MQTVRLGSDLPKLEIPYLEGLLREAVDNRSRELWLKTSGDLVDPSAFVGIEIGYWKVTYANRQVKRKRVTDGKTAEIDAEKAHSVLRELLSTRSELPRKVEFIHNHPGHFASPLSGGDARAAQGTKALLHSLHIEGPFEIHAVQRYNGKTLLWSAIP